MAPLQGSCCWTCRPPSGRSATTRMTARTTSTTGMPSQHIRMPSLSRCCQDPTARRSCRTQLACSSTRGRLSKALRGRLEACSSCTSRSDARGASARSAGRPSGAARTIATRRSGGSARASWQTPCDPRATPTSGPDASSKPLQRTPAPWSSAPRTPGSGATVRPASHGSGRGRLPWQTPRLPSGRRLGGSRATSGRRASWSRTRTGTAS
mmetsp:Transcript_29100/g.91717  ORF Transcript_29100/g.91717 Transcript_29100/m.91717 type:complete len:210 (-) Transcript_29100:79-708(-)